MATLNKNELISALTRMGELALADGKDIELMVVGGGVMVLEFDARLSTRDLDVIIMPPNEPQWIRSLANIVANERGWAEGWLNDAAKGFMVGVSLGPVIFNAPGISVIRPIIEQLLAMKLCAWRDDVDISDARRLLREVNPAYNHDEAWNNITRFVQPGRELKAKYAFDDLWEELHDTH